MDAKVLYWSAALLNMAVIVALAGTAVRQVRRGDVAAHKRSMTIAGTLVVAFLVSFLMKSFFLGFEDYSRWTALHVNNLRVHESFVALMLIAALYAASRAWKFRATRNVTKDRNDPIAPEALLRAHRRAGWTAIVCSAFGFATAVVILAGMIERAG